MSGKMSLTGGEIQAPAVCFFLKGSVAKLGWSATIGAPPGSAWPRGTLCSAAVQLLYLVLPRSYSPIVRGSDWPLTGSTIRD